MVINQQNPTTRTSHQLIIELSELSFWIKELPARIAKQEVRIPYARNKAAYIERLNDDRVLLEEYKARFELVQTELANRNGR